MKLILNLVQIIDCSSESITLKSVSVESPYSLTLDKTNRSRLIITTPTFSEYFEFETEYQCVDCLTYVTTVYGNIENEKEVVVLDLLWNDKYMEDEREKLRTKRRDAWEECECRTDEGCDKCLLREDLKYTYNKSLNRF